MSKNKTSEPLPDESIKSRSFKKPVVCAGAILIKKNRFLFGKRAASKDWAPGLWDIVGGKALKNEHPLLTLQRETWEETGIQVRNAELLSTIDVFDEKGAHLLFHYHIFMVTNFKGKAINRSDEHTKLKWLTRKELDQKQLALPQYITLIDQWLSLQPSKKKLQ